MQIKEATKKLICFITCSAVFLCSVICINTNVFAVTSTIDYTNYIQSQDITGAVLSLNQGEALVDGSIVTIHLVGSCTNGTLRAYLSNMYDTGRVTEVQIFQGLGYFDVTLTFTVDTSLSGEGAPPTHLYIKGDSYNTVMDDFCITYADISYSDPNASVDSDYNESSDTVEYVFYADALYELFSKGIWSFTYTLNDELYTTTSMSLSYDTDGYGVVMSVYPTDSSLSGSLTGADYIIEFNEVYDDVISVESYVASTFTVKDTFTSTPSYYIANGAYMHLYSDTGLTYGSSVLSTLTSNAGYISYYDYDGSTRYYRENIPLLHFDVDSFDSNNDSIYTMSYHVSYGFTRLSDVYFTSSSFAIKELRITCLGENSAKLDELISKLETTNTKIDAVADEVRKVEYVIGQQVAQDKEFYDSVTEQTEEDKTALDEIEQGMQDAQDKADEFKDAMGDVETPKVEDVLPDDSVDNILQDENIVEGQPYIFSILESLQSITWLLLMVLISVTVGVIKYIIYGKT